MGTGTRPGPDCVELLLGRAEPLADPYDFGSELQEKSATENELQAKLSTGTDEQQEKLATDMNELETNLPSG
ncbi:hypothetical protein H4Q26_007265 [Puccinia striiformis f. sp. tritici PST-130]|nr:hypothetical protein H4Q26_007265 [Puccinia striiformis f. sp. tritici PST-130]